MKNKINKKVMIAIFFSLIMFAGAFAVMSGNSGTALPVINNVPATSTSNNSGNISYIPCGFNNSYIDKVNFTNCIDDKAVYRGYISFDRYVTNGSVSISIYFSNFTFAYTNGTLVNLHTYSNINSTIKLENYLETALFVTIGNNSNMTSDPENYTLPLSDYDISTSNSLVSKLYHEEFNRFFIDDGKIAFVMSNTISVKNLYSFHEVYSDEEIIHKHLDGAVGTAYNPYYNNIYSFSAGQFEITILNGTTYTYVENFSSSAMAFSGTYDPYNHNEYIYSVNDVTPADDPVCLVHGTNYTKLSSTSEGLVASAYDPVNHDVYAISSNMLGLYSPLNGIYVMNGTSIIDHIDYSSGANDFSVIYDKYNGMIYAPDDISSTSYGIAEIDPVNNTYVGLISTPEPVNLMAINPVNHEIYASTYMKSTGAPIYVYNASTMSYIGTMGVLSSMMGIKVVDGYLYVEGNDSTLDVFSPDNSLAYSYVDVNTKASLMGLAYDNDTNKVIVDSMGYVTPPNQGVLPTLMAAFTPGVPVGNLSLQFEEYDNGTQLMTVKLYNNAYSFAESGDGNVIFSELQSGIYNYIATSDSQSENGTVNLTHSETISLKALGEEYGVIIDETGLPSGTTWTFTFNGISKTIPNTSYTFHEINGTYSLSVNSISGYTVNYDNSVEVNGANVSDHVVFTPIQQYTVTISETGLPSNTSWSYTFNSVQYTLTNTSYTFHEINGTYLLHANPANYDYPIYNPLISVSGANITETIQYSLYDYHIFNHTPVIGYWLNNTVSNGIFSYHDYNFTEKVLNQTSIFIETNSIHAPNVTLSFKVSNGVYDVLMTNANNTTSVINQTSPVNGYINVTYNPSKMPLDPTFSVSEVNCVVAPAPPPLPPGGPVQVISHPFKYFDYSIWTILMWIGIAAGIAAVAYVLLRRL